MNESGKKAPETASARLALLKGIRAIPVTKAAAELARKVVISVSVQVITTPDAVHMSLASVHGIEFLVTWNFKAHSKPADP